MPPPRPSWRRHRVCSGFPLVVTRFPSGAAPHCMRGPERGKIPLTSGRDSMDFFASGLSPEDLRRRVGHLSQVAGVRLLTSGDGPSRGVRLHRVPHRHRLCVRDRRRSRLRCRAGRVSRRLARLDAADADAGPVVLRGSVGLRLAARRARRLQQYLRPVAYRQSRGGLGRALQLPRPADRALRRP